MKRIISLFLILFLAGCMNQYQKKEYSWGAGHSETQLDKNIFRVTYTGDEFTSAEASIDFSLLRCAELTIENGYNYFSIIEKNTSVKTEVYSVPATYQTYSSGYGAATTYTYGGGTYSSSSPSSDNTIMMFKEKPSTGIPYSAEFVAKSIRDKYEIKCVHVTTSLEISYKRNKTRNDKEQVPKIAYSVYKKYYEEPTENEGFTLYTI